MTIEKHTPAGTDISIWAETANINYFLQTALTPDSQTGVVNKTSAVKAHTRRRYAGDTSPSNVSGHSREFMFDPGRRNGAALPGEPFILDDGTEKRRFSFQGNVMDLHAFLKGDAKMDFTFYSPSAAYEIAKKENEG